MTTRVPILIAFLWLCAPPILAQQSGADPQGRHIETWAEVEKIDAKLRKHKWKQARTQARRLADKVVKNSWHGIELNEILAELAFQQAAAHANLDDRRAAVWHWLIAQTLDASIVSKDFTGYGLAGKRLREYRLRSYGKVPPGFTTYPRDGKDQPPGLPTLPAPRILTNTGASLEKPGDFVAELVIDEKGVMHFPVLITTSLHPIVIYFVMAAMLDFPAFEPARYEGKPVDCIYELTIRFYISGWVRR